MKHWICFSVFALPLAAFAIDPCSIVWHRVTEPSSPNSPGQRIHQAVAYDKQRGVAVVFGGRNAVTGELWTADTWEWNGINWIKQEVTAPPGRFQAAMAYDSHRRVCVMFGGGTNSFAAPIPFNDTWEWDGVTWTRRVANDVNAIDRPPPLLSAMMVYDSRRRRIVLVGAVEFRAGEPQKISNTWEWNGYEWSWHPPPPARIGAALAFDEARGVTVLVGGSPYQGVGQRGDTWTWDGLTWSLVATNGPPPRFEHAMTFDERRQVLVLVGGINSGIDDLFNDTWEWNGSTWTLFPDADNLGFNPRRLHHMWFNSREQKMEIFGGTFSLQSPNGTYSHYVLDDVFAARTPGLWIDFTYAGPENGTFEMPFNVLANAVTSAPNGCRLNFKAGSTEITVTISKPLHLDAFNGPVHLGVP